MKEGPQAPAAREAGLPDIVVQRWGRVPYAEALARQLALHASRAAGEGPDTLVVVEHPPTITLGRHATDADVSADRGQLAEAGIDVLRTDRGGLATWHGPGQVVVYPIVSIHDLGLGPKAWVCLLEAAILDTLAEYGVQGQRRPGTAGIWTEGGKIASLGLRIARGVSYHGLAVNTGLDASVFDYIVTCGVRSERVTTIAAESGRVPADDDVAARLTTHIIRRMRERQHDVHPFP